MVMTTIVKEKDPNDQFSETRCKICNFPAGKFTNKETGETKRVFFYKAKGGGYICNNCVKEGRGVRVIKLDKKSRRAIKFAIRGR